MNYANGRSLSTAYDNRLRPTTWNVANVLGYNYSYDYFNEHTGRVTYAGSTVDSSLDRSYEYDQAGRLVISHSGAEARAHAWTGQWGTMDGPYSQGYDFDVWGNVTHKYGWGGEVQGGGAGQSSDIYYTYTNNRRNGFSYDGAGNLINDIGQQFTYDVTGQQTASSYTNLQNWYDGDGLRVKRTEDGLYPALFLRSSVLGGQVVAEIDYVGGSWQWWRGYVYAGSQLLAVQQGGVFFVHEDAVTKSKRVTDMSGAIQSTIELDPWGADTNRSSNSAFQPKKFTNYERDGNGSDEAMFRRYNRWQSRFDQPDPYDGSYDLGDPQSFNRYAYVQGDPVNFVDPTGLDDEDIDRLVFWIWASSYGHGGGNENGTAQGPANPWADALPKRLWGPQKPSQANQWEIQRDYWKQWGKKLYDCLSTVFKGDAAAAKKWLDSHGLPDVDFSRTSPELRLFYNEGEYPRAIPSPYEGPSGTIYVSAEYAPPHKPMSWVFETMTHETGNIMGFFLAGQDWARSEQKYGNPNGITDKPNARPGSGDKDAGANLEKCVHGSVRY